MACLEGLPGESLFLGLQSCKNNVLWTYEINVEVSDHNEQRHITPHYGDGLAIHQSSLYSRVRCDGI